jgi:3-hydroxyisobutyrate dehydrogenase
MSKIGFIGLGAMGQPMAHLLHQGGHSLVVRDTQSAAQNTFCQAHPQALAAQQDADFADCDFVITMLPNSAIVEQVLRALAPLLKPKSIVIEMSSADPTRTRELARLLASHGVGMIDAPVSGGVKKAVAGTLAIMVGGDDAVFLACKPVLELMGKAITQVGPIGAGHALKALNNYVSAAGMIAAIEAVHVGAAFGIDRAVIVDVMNASTGQNNTTLNKIHQYMLNDAFNSGFSLALQAKDVGIAADLGPALGLKMPLAEIVSGMTQAASEQLGPKADHTELYKVFDLKD